MEGLYFHTVNLNKIQPMREAWTAGLRISVDEEKMNFILTREERKVKYGKR